MDKYTMNNDVSHYGAKNISRRRFIKTSTAIGSFSSLAPSMLMASGFTQSLSQNPIARNPLQFNGERRDPATGLYHLGNGYRMYNPGLMRFHACDNMSPFGKGGINSYAYCLGDPINNRDPSGHFALLSLLIGAIVGAVTGAALSIAMEGITSTLTGTKFDWKQVGIGAALGFISGGFGAAAQGAKFSTQLGFAMLDSTFSGAVDFSLNAVAGTPLKQAAINAGIGSIIGLGSFASGTFARKLYSDRRASLMLNTPIWQDMVSKFKAIPENSSVSAADFARGVGTRGLLVTPDGFLNGYQLGSYLKKNKMVSNSSRRFVLEAAYSADGGNSSLAQALSNSLNKEVVGFKGALDLDLVAKGCKIGNPVLFSPQKNQFRQNITSVKHSSLAYSNLHIDFSPDWRWFDA